MEVPGEGIKAQGARECELEVPDYTIRSSTRLGKLRMFKHSRFKGEQSMGVWWRRGQKQEIRSRKGLEQDVLRARAPGVSSDQDKVPETHRHPAGPRTLRPGGSKGSSAWVLWPLETLAGWDPEERMRGRHHILRKVDVGCSTCQQRG